jgi:Deoxyribonuclease NucA/NucB
MSRRRKMLIAFLLLAFNLMLLAQLSGEPCICSPATPTVSIFAEPPTFTPNSRPSRNNGSPCDPNNLPPLPPARNTGINFNPLKPQFTINLSKSRFPETAAHIEAAQNAGHPRYLTIDRAGNIGNVRRNLAINICPELSGFERDEFPMAMFREGGKGASVRYVTPSDNKGAGAHIGNLLRSYPDGTIIA